MEDNGDFKFSDKAESSGDGDAVDLAVSSTDMLGPFIDGLLPVSSVSDSQERQQDCVGCSEFITVGEAHVALHHADVKPGDTNRLEEFLYGDPEYLSREGAEDLINTDVEDEAVSRNRPSCSESCDSFVSAASRLEPYAEREELHKMFKTFDENGDGKISCEELGNTMRKLGYEMTDSELKGMMVAVDNDGDGYVDFDEFLSLYSTLYYDGEEHKARLDVLEDEHELQDAFQVFDKNKDGYISVVELQAVLSSLGLKEGAKLVDCQKMIKAVDTDGDGQVNFEEFKNMMSSALFKQG